MCGMVLSNSIVYVWSDHTGAKELLTAQEGEGKTLKPTTDDSQHRMGSGSLLPRQPAFLEHK